MNAQAGQGPLSPYIASREVIAEWAFATPSLSFMGSPYVLVHVVSPPFVLPALVDDESMMPQRQTDTPPYAGPVIHWGSRLILHSLSPPFDS
jgi:hypothetical protein